MIEKCIVCRKIAVVRFENYTDVQGILVLHTNIPTYTKIHKKIYLYRVSKEECARFRESVPYVKLYR